MIRARHRDGPDGGIRMAPLAIDSYAQYRREVIFSCYKWDPQVGDFNTVADHAVVLSSDTAGHLARCAEGLASETAQMENVLLSRLDLCAELGIPRAIAKAMFRAGSRSGADGPRVMRFDFHPSTAGWVVSEVNSDVPGGFAEASCLPRLAARFVPGTRAMGDPVRAIGNGFSRRLPGGGRIALVHATSYTDDRQVMRCLADGLRDAGFATALVAPDHLRWSADGRAVCLADGQSGPVAGIVRYFPVEWLRYLPRRSGWQGYFASAEPSCNHPRALLTQSKRLPLVWDRLPVDSDLWRSMLPETRRPGWAGLRPNDRWVFKPAFGRVGEGITIREVMSRKERRGVLMDALLAPGRWVMQKRFESRLLETAAGPRHVCVGAFTVDGHFAGFYGRMSARPRIDQHACDVPVLVDEAESEEQG